ncbi:acetyl-CoA carboxylase biotin carboxyl carrier protein [Murimonas intestini]|uniref:acetyl-CoA carboxylase biotin carboxyl carrier protein n=1 Tax=Murimonas intestini TaxID=1337051 RepID=UPI0011DD812D|nr:acetyl-CoA carboxylase biotin carboxyl carrier protein [Murimonas intestini]
MDLKQIEELVKIIEKSSLTEFSVKEGDLKITMSKINRNAAAVEGLAAAEAVQELYEAETEEDEAFITSPIVGTFYAAASPEEPPFVSVGDVVKAGQTVCILEAMKLMNEIQSDFECEIEAVLVSNEQKVEYGQPLFRVKKL